MKPTNHPCAARMGVLLGALAVVALTLSITFGLRGKREAPAELPELTHVELKLENGRLYRVGETNAFHGFLIEKYEEGTLKSRSAISNGGLHGISEGWHTNGTLQIREPFVNGVSHGLRQKWHENGAKMSEAHIVDGKLDGIFRRWHDNGQLAEQISMKQGLAEGAGYSFHPTGFLKMEATLKDGKVVSEKSWKETDQKTLKLAAQ
jgi:antitoxin component YwqK of YwqJK toxin-antitoxin module